MKYLIIILTFAALASIAVPAEACFPLPFGARARERRQDRQAARQASYGKAGLGCSGVGGGLLRTILPPYGR
jgi:hypothetical protein